MLISATLHTIGHLLALPVQQCRAANLDELVNKTQEAYVNAGYRTELIDLQGILDAVGAQASCLMEEQQLSCVEALSQVDRHHVKRWGRGAGAVISDLSSPMPDTELSSLPSYITLRCFNLAQRAPGT